MREECVLLVHCSSAEFHTHTLPYWMLTFFSRPWHFCVIQISHSMRFCIPLCVTALSCSSLTCFFLTSLSLLAQLPLSVCVCVCARVRAIWECLCLFNV